MSAERLRRFFVELDGRCRIAKPIRDACVLAQHNVLTDPPFSRMDLVSCRNMLIYLGAALQREAGLRRGCLNIVDITSMLDDNLQTGALRGGHAVFIGFIAMGGITHLAVGVFALPAPGAENIPIEIAGSLKRRALTATRGGVGRVERCVVSVRHNVGFCNACARVLDQPGLSRLARPLHNG